MENIAHNWAGSPSAGIFLDSQAESRLLFQSPLPLRPAGRSLNRPPWERFAKVQRSAGRAPRQLLLLGELVASWLGGGRCTPDSGPLILRGLDWPPNREGDAAWALERKNLELWRIIQRIVGQDLLQPLAAAHRTRWGALRHSHIMSRTTTPWKLFFVPLYWRTAVGASPRRGSADLGRVHS